MVGNLGNAPSVLRFQNVRITFFLIPEKLLWWEAVVTLHSPEGIGFTDQLLNLLAVTSRIIYVNGAHSKI